MLTTAQKRVIGLFVISLLVGTFVFVGFKDIGGKTYKVFRQTPVEFGIENGTINCSHCERQFYLKLSTKVKYENITTSSIIIPNSIYKEMFKLELFD